MYIRLNKKTKTYFMFEFLLQKWYKPIVRSNAVIGFLAVGQTIDVANNGFHSYYYFWPYKPNLMKALSNPNRFI